MSTKTIWAVLLLAGMLTATAMHLPWWRQTADVAGEGGGSEPAADADVRFSTMDKTWGTTRGTFIIWATNFHSTNITLSLGTWTVSDGPAITTWTNAGTVTLTNGTRTALGMRASGYTAGYSDYTGEAVASLRWVVAGVTNTRWAGSFYTYRMSD